jgi:hypothetical protein
MAHPPFFYEFQGNLRAFLPKATRITGSMKRNLFSSFMPEAESRLFSAGQEANQILTSLKKWGFDFCAMLEFAGIPLKRKG